MSDLSSFSVCRRWLRALGGKRVSRDVAPSVIRNRRLALEELGERVTPATLTWTGAAGNNQVATAGNWNPVQAPANGDILLFNGAGGPAANTNAEFSANAPTILSRIETSGAYSAQLIFEQNTNVGDLMQISGQPASISVDSNVSLTATTTQFVGGTLTGGGTFEVPAGGSLSIGGPTTVSVPTVTIRSGAAFNVAQDLTLSGMTQVTSSGTVNWSAGSVTVGGGSTFNNQGTFVITGDLGMVGNGQFNNYGTLVKQAGLGATTFYISFSNLSATGVEVQSGELNFDRGGTDSGGRYVVNAGAKVTFSGGNVRTVSGYTQWQGSGQVVVEGRIMIAAGISLDGQDPQEGQYRQMRS